MCIYVCICMYICVCVGGGGGLMCVCVCVCVCLHVCDQSTFQTPSPEQCPIFSTPHPLHQPLNESPESTTPPGDGRALRRGDGDPQAPQQLHEAPATVTQVHHPAAAAVPVCWGACPDAAHARAGMYIHVCIYCIIYIYIEMGEWGRGRGRGMSE
jgi:hypothetical protein